MIYNRHSQADQHGYLSQHHQTYTTDAISTATTAGTISATSTAAVPVIDDVSDDVIAVDEGDGEGQGQGQTEGEDAPLRHLVNLDSTAHGT